MVMPLITRLEDGGAIWIILALALLLYPKTQKTGGDSPCIGSLMQQSDFETPCGPPLLL